MTIRGKEALHFHEWGLRGRLVRRLLPESDSVIAVSESLKELCILAGVSPGRISVIGNGVDTAAFRACDRNVCREKLGLYAAGRIILAVGSMTPVKGFDRIIAALPEVLRSFPDATLCIVGGDGDLAGGDAGRELRSQAQKLGLADKIRFVGEIANKELVAWYNAADVFCLSSRSEGSPNVLMEALSCGCPAVATDVGSAAAIVSEDFLGTIVDNVSGDVTPACRGLASGLIATLAKPYDRQRIAAHMRQHNWDSCTGK